MEGQLSLSNIQKGYEIEVRLTRGVEYKDLCHADRGDDPRGTYVVEAATEDNALDDFHSTIPISCLEHFDILCEPYFPFEDTNPSNKEFL